MSVRVLIVDNGGDTLKYGWAHDDDDDDDDNDDEEDQQQQRQLPKRIPNVTARLKHQFTILVGDQMEQMARSNPNQMYAITRSTERGIITNIGNQVQVWKRMLDLMGVMVRLDSEASKAFGWKVQTTRRATKVSKQQKQQQAAAAAEDSKKKIPASMVAVLLLVPPHCPRVILDQIMYVWMEDFGVAHVGFATSQICATKPHPDFECGCLVDLGWSATHIVPTFRGQVIPSSSASSSISNNYNTEMEEGGASTATANNNGNEKATTTTTTRRLSLGGRQLVNIWKYYTSYRQWNLMDQEWIMRDVFQDLAYVSLDFHNDIQMGRQTPLGRRPFDRNFVLPNYQTTFRGHVELTEPLKRQQQQQQQEAEAKEQLERDAAAAAVEDESDDEDFDHDNSQEDEGGDGNGDDDNDNEDDNDEDVGENTDAIKGTRKRKPPPKKKQKKRKKKGRQEEDEDDDNDDEDDDDDDEDDEDNNKDLLRQRLLRQKHEEERRRQEQEAEQQVLAVSVERFTIPEVLFHPSDAGLPTEMAGLHHAISQCIKSCPRHFQPALFRSIQLCGGLAQLPNLVERLHRDLRPLVPERFDLEITLADNPTDAAWLGARDWARRTPHTQWSVSRDEWESGQKRKAWIKLLASKGGVLV